MVELMDGENKKFDGQRRFGRVVDGESEYGTVTEGEEWSDQKSD